MSSAVSEGRTRPKSPLGQPTRINRQSDASTNRRRDRRRVVAGGSIPSLRAPPKSDISDFDHSIVPNSGKPEFGGVGIEPQSVEVASGPTRRLDTKRRARTIRSDAWVVRK